MMVFGIVFLVFVAVLIPMTAIIGALYVGWLAEQQERPRESGLPELKREPTRLASHARPAPVVVPH